MSIQKYSSVCFLHFSLLQSNKYYTNIHWITFKLSCTLYTLMVTLKLAYVGHIMRGSEISLTLQIAEEKMERSRQKWFARGK